MIKYNCFIFWLCYINLQQGHEQNKCMIIFQQKGMQIIDKPKQTVLPLTVRRKFGTEQSQHVNDKLRASVVKKKLRIQLKRIQDCMHSKFIYYDLNYISEQARKKMKKALFDNMTVHKNTKLGSILLSTKLVESIAENLKPVSYNSAIYPVLITYINQIFQQVMGIAYNNTFIAQGQVSLFYYMFFDNCFEVPYSNCCKDIIYLRIQATMHSNFASFRAYINKNEGQIRRMKTQLICQKCKTEVVQFYGELRRNQIEEVSATKIKQQLIIDEQRRKLSIGVMVGSGKYKNYRINSPERAKKLNKFNPESIFISKKGVASESKKIRLSSQPSIKTSALLRQQRYKIIDFYPTLIQ